jgi:hypothetical protein
MSTLVAGIIIEGLGKELENGNEMKLKTVIRIKNSYCEWPNCWLGWSDSAASTWVPFGGRVVMSSGFRARAHT